MVMEPPSPEAVGQAFVEQYYTILNKAPLQLHRFYNEKSSFVHGEVSKSGVPSPPVMGQAEIHKKIISLGFSNCHAKIRQVDSQLTVQDAVVVQVTGELSNNGSEMRRFMQTFVLVPQSAKKYYLHNDIFRYQDDVFIDEESDSEEEQEGTGSETAEITDAKEPEPVPIEPEPPVVGSFETSVEVRAPVEVRTSVEVRTLTNGGLEKPQEEARGWDEVVEEQQQEAKRDEPPPPSGEEIEDTEKNFSWARMAGGGSGDQAPPAANYDRSSVPQRMPRGDTRTFAPPTRYSDAQQVFVGNMPTDIHEQEIFDCFGEFGNVVDVRINGSKDNQQLPFYGFVVFDSPSGAQTTLNHKPINIRGTHRLNVEEKKQRGDLPLTRGRGSLMRGSRGGPPRGRGRGSVFGRGR